MRGVLEVVRGQCYTINCLSVAYLSMALVEGQHMRKVLGHSDTVLTVCNNTDSIYLFCQSATI